MSFPSSSQLFFSFLSTKQQQMSASLRDWGFGGKSLDHKARDKWGLCFSMSLLLCSVSLVRALPFSLTYRDAVSSVTITKLKHQLDFRMSSTSLCVVTGGRKGTCV